MATPAQLSWQQLVAIARRVGVQVVEAPSSHRGKLGKMGSVAGITAHHTGTPNTYKPTEDYPDYNVVKEGRSGLENSLSAFGIGRHTAIYVFSEFLSWHAGTWNWNGITDGNGHFLGIECAGVSDFTPFQRAVYPRLVAAILLEIKAPRTMAPTHALGAMPRGRKTDATNLANFDQGKEFYELVDFYLAHPEFINVNYRPTVEEIKKELKDMTVIITASDSKDGAVKRAPALMSGLGGFIGLGSDAEKANARAALPEIWVEEYTWDALAAEKKAMLDGARAAVETVELQKQILAALKTPAVVSAPPA